jgi:hypothetical protein
MLDGGGNVPLVVAAEHPQIRAARATMAGGRPHQRRAITDRTGGAGIVVGLTTKNRRIASRFATDARITWTAPDRSEWSTFGGGS